MKKKPLAAAPRLIMREVVVQGEGEVVGIA